MQLGTVEGVQVNVVDSFGRQLGDLLGGDVGRNLVCRIEIALDPVEPGRHPRRHRRPAALGEPGDGRQ